LQSHLLELFAACGIDRERIELREFAATSTAHLSTYGDIDIALDPFPYNGTTTTCEAMWMGVPVVTLIGDRHTGRVGFDLLTRVGLPDLAAPTTAAYVATATALALDLPRLRQLRVGLRERMRASPLCDAPGFARAFERVLRAMWQDRCGTQTDKGKAQH
jgi:predicted O-linked N-acetylglucosamine transferase (SPINDLY family)